MRNTLTFDLPLTLTLIVVNINGKDSQKNEGFATYTALTSTHRQHGQNWLLANIQTYH